MVALVVALAVALMSPSLRFFLSLLAAPPSPYRQSVVVEATVTLAALPHEDLLARLRRSCLPFSSCLAASERGINRFPVVEKKQQPCLTVDVPVILSLSLLLASNFVKISLPVTNKEFSVEICTRPTLWMQGKSKVECTVAFCTTVGQRGVP